MQKKYFGTDGIRGKSNSGIITPEVMIKIAMATAVACNFAEKRTVKPTIIIGKDTRLSGYMLEFALTSGFISMGINIILVGPIPTPAISMLVRSLRADLGMMISASHNPYYDNGIKFFNSSGYKISAELEDKIEQLMSADLSRYVAHCDDLGKATKLDDARGRYIEYVKSSFPPSYKLDGIKVVVDCANGAAYDIAPKVFRELGAEVIACGVNPNGFNINRNSGVLHYQILAHKVVEHRANLGIALDGDSDRILIIDENGKLIDGDQMIGAIAHYLSMNNELKDNIVVTTIMSNMGLELYLRTIGVTMIRTSVGDKYVVQKMQELGCNLGGEQSGHIIIGLNQATGDGIKAALQALAIYKIAHNVPISRVFNKFTPIPQLTHNMRYNPTHHDDTQNTICKSMIEDIAKSYQERYFEEARIIVRKSGTEPVIRLMIETINLKLGQILLSTIQGEIKKALNIQETS